jgi:hypothetical protein
MLVVLVRVVLVVVAGTMDDGDHNGWMEPSNNEDDDVEDDADLEDIEGIRQRT